MGGKILDYPAKDILNQGRAEGRAEGRVEGRVEGRMQAVLELLGELGVVPEEIEKKINEERDVDVLSRWLKLAARAESVDEFVKGM